MLDNRTWLHVIDASSVCAWRYKDEVIQASFCEVFPTDVDPGFLFMTDNAKQYIALIVDDFLKEDNIRHKDKSAKSSDINPREYI